VHTERVLLRASFFLFLLAMLTGLAIPAFHNPRLALSAHLTGLLNSFVLTSLAVAWPRLHADEKRRKLLKTMFIASAYTIWFSNVLGAAWGTSWLTPMAGKGFHADYWQQVFVAALIIATVWTYIIAASLVLYGLRTPATETSDTREERDDRDR
jgi:hydroxylaminobenzene mutase